MSIHPPLDTEDLATRMAIVAEAEREAVKKRDGLYGRSSPSLTSRDLAVFELIQGNTTALEISTALGISMQCARQSLNRLEKSGKARTTKIGANGLKIWEKAVSQ